MHNIDIHTVASIGFYQNMLTDTPITYAALRKQNQFNRVAGPYVMMMYPNMLFPITYRNYSAGNVHPGDISKQKPIKEAAEQYKLTDPESIAIANYLRREYTDEPEIDVQEMENEVNVEAPHSSDNMYYSAREPLTFLDKREVVGGYSDLAGDPFMMGHIATAGFNFAFDDIGTMIDPDATAEDKMMAGLFLFAKPAKLVGKGADAFKAGDKVKDARKVDKGTVKKIDSDTIKKYIRDVERRTGRELPKNQIEKLKVALRNKEYKKMSPIETAKHRAEFDKVKYKVIKEWEENTGQKWPLYNENVISEKTGKIIRKQEDKYDAHHIIENTFGGEHEWWNMHPAKFPNEHQAGIHGTGSPANTLFKGGKK